MVKDKIDSDPEYRELKKKDIKLIIYNNRDKIDKNQSNINNDKSKEIEV